PVWEDDVEVVEVEKHLVWEQHSEVEKGDEGDGAFAPARGPGQEVIVQEAIRLEVIIGQEVINQGAMAEVELVVKIV
ncbi:MAG: hypothetical protein Q9215_007573, partial [Flavoplaca cf. flavocitrina]